MALVIALVGPALRRWGWGKGGARDFKRESYPGSSLSLSTVRNPYISLFNLFSERERETNLI